ncbi:colanic acid biosynthesis protein WcaH [Amphritea atlantica]|uniref:Colanic acid biosynthesis protein WcaH n=1 Tax=Amphritea atlantica TaxID=355243 RepID=A0A1H9LTU3_9GAMM|nr:GDP-mannose mannosyl hydrolase [Amphritea atlantica]SER14881.1 colanic acid biosynthesis protein WcaH [Amphritea atlantica]
MSNSYLTSDNFRLVVDSTPLISIDLVVKDPDGSVLLGKRLNKPAKDYWFVPGGRVLKNETLADAFLRLTEAELGIKVPIQSARYLGLYEHFYDDSALSDAVSTHYVVNAFVIELSESVSALPVEQHSDYQWLSETELLGADDVHIHSKWYFMNEKGYSV